MNDKPISIVIDDLKQNIADTINASGLHPCIVEPILKDLYLELSNIAKVQLEKDKQTYEASQKEEIVED